MTSWGRRISALSSGTSLQRSEYGSLKLEVWITGGVIG
eukprot:CAMPEP_0198224428 /NCGR_PEP_ID=MMETSP1445-20131203/96922_1 /TAXON_ID=36898 /ORGANISM="Pyramimonas sp., Strain CCMP2087" /LENGTH=37 /DNA_ID= /DNA_START= /DNA_END= /DNA_ORIENTATION=